jgi:hypothetical protein
MRLCQAAVAAVAQAMSVDRFRDSGLAACPDGIAPLPVAGLLVFPDLGLDLLLGLGQQEGERQQTAGESSRRSVVLRPKDGFEDQDRC